jgi:urease accessory protein
MRTIHFKTLGAATLLLAFPALVQAHPVAGDPQGFHHGFVHPLTGLDHLLAMLAIGVWAAQQGGRAVWLIPATFIGFAAVGGAAGMLGGALPGAELVIALSVLVLGLLVASSARLNPGIGLLVAAGFAVFHGYAHGREMPIGVSSVAYGSGFIVATISLHAAGLLTGFGLNLAGRPALLRYAGAAMAVSSLLFFLA